MAATVESRRFQIVRWSIFTVLTFAYIGVFFHRLAPAVVSGELMAAFGTSAGALGSLAAMYYYIAAAMQIPSGVIADTVGTRVAVATGNLVAGIGSIMFGLAPTFAIATVGRFLVGLGVSVVFVCFMKNNAVWFSERRYGLVSGLTLLIGNIGSILAAAPLAAALRSFSWRPVFVGIGVTSLVLSVLSLLVVRNRPEDLGFPAPDGPAGAIRQKTRPLARRHWPSDLGEVLRNRHVWPSFVINFGMLGTLYAFTGLWSVPLLRDLHGLDRSAAANYNTVTLIGFATGALSFGWISDRLGVRKPVMLFSAGVYCCSWLAFLLLPWAVGPSGILLFTVMGFAGGGFILTYPCAKEVVHPALAGMAISVVNTGVFLGAALMQPLFGWVLDLGWQGAMQGDVRVYARAAYDPALVLIIGFAVLALVAALLLRETHCRNLTIA